MNMGGHLTRSELRGPALWSILAITTALASCWATPGAAQEASEITENEIVVTAQRRAERLENVPMAITSLSADAISKAGAKNIADLGQITPGVLISFNGAVTQPAIRGVSNVVAGNAFENNVSIYVDGFYTPDTVSISGDFASVASVEILKGPQGTLYGRNATGGAILINTRAPSETYTASFDASYGRFNEKIASTYVSGPITEKIRFGIAGYWRSSDGYIRLQDPARIGATFGHGAKEESRAVRAKLEFDLTETLKITTGLNYGYLNDPRPLLFTVLAYPSTALPPPPARAPLGEPDIKSPNLGTKNSAQTREVTLKADFDTDFGKLALSGAYSKRVLDQIFDFDGSYSDITYSRVHLLLDTYQSAFDVTVDSIDRLTVVAGGSYYHDYKRTNPADTFGAGRVLAQRAMQGTKAIAWAGYLDATYAFTDALTLNAGGRYTTEKRTVDFQTQAAIGGVPNGPFLFPPTHKSVRFNKFVPRASLRYEIAPRTNVYLAYSQGFKSGGWNFSGAPSPALLLPIKPENITAYELGFKTASRVLRLDVSAFYYDYKDIHVSQLVPNPLCVPTPTAPCASTVLTTNGPKSEIYGVDGQLTVTPTEALNLRLGAAYLHARYINFANATGTGLNPVTNLNVQGQVQDLSGKQMARSPAFSASAGIDYTLKTAVGDLLFVANGSYTTGYVVSNLSLFGGVAPPAIANKYRYRQSGYALLNGQVTWTDPSGHVSVGAFAKNITNKRYFTNYAGTAFGDYGVYAAPRTYGIRAGFKY